MQAQIALRIGDTWFGVLYGLIAALIWGAWPVFSQIGLNQSLNAYDLAALRFGISGIILAPVVLRHGLGKIRLGGALLMTCGAGVPYVLVVVTGLGFAPAAHAGMVGPSIMLTLTALGGWVLFKDAMTQSRLLGFAVILLGVVLIGWQSFVNHGQAGAWRGDLLYALGGSLWAGYTLTARKLGLNPLLATAQVSVLSMVLYLPWYMLSGVSNMTAAPLQEVAVHGVFQGVFTAIIALLFYTKSVQILGATRGAVFAALVPAIALMLSALFLGHSPSGAEMAGMVAISVGMLAALGIVRPKM